MPAQTTGVNLLAWGQGDTAPAREVTLADDDDNPINLSNATSVTIRISYATWSHYYSPWRTVVEADPCVIVDAGTGVVSYQPSATFTNIAGNYHAKFTITWNDATTQQVPTISYVPMVIHTKPGGTA